MKELGQTTPWRIESQTPRAATGLLISRCGEPQLEEPCNLGVKRVGWRSNRESKVLGYGAKIEGANGVEGNGVGSMGGLWKAN